MRMQTKKINQRTGVSTFASPASPSTNQSLQKSFHLSIPVDRIQNIFSCPSKKIKTPDTQTNPTKTVKLNNDHGLPTRWTRTPAGNSTFAIDGVSCSADSLVQGGSSVLRINICGEKSAHRKSANRYSQW